MDLTEGLKFCQAKKQTDDSYDHYGCSTLDDIKKAWAAAIKTGMSALDEISAGKRSMPLITWLHNQAMKHDCLLHEEVEWIGEKKTLNNSVDLIQFIAWLGKSMGVSFSGTIQRKVDLPTLWFEFRRGRYWIEVEDGKWECLSETAAKRKLKQAGLSGVSTIPGALSEVDHELVNISDKAGIEWAGRLAGYRAGILTYTNGRYFDHGWVRASVEPKEGEFRLIKEILTRMLGDEQHERFCYWLKVSYEALQDNRSQVGQMLVMVGPIDCLKSFVQHWIITPVLGGRSADGARYSDWWHEL